MSRVENMPVYQRQQFDFPAEHYNLWRRARSHITLPVRFALAGLRNLVAVVDRHELLCADESMQDLPVLCWHRFEDQGRDSLHTPVKCWLNYYHFAAEKIRDQVLEQIKQELQGRLH